MKVGLVFKCWAQNNQTNESADEGRKEGGVGKKETEK
jgi:hypothetical protein